MSIIKFTLCMYELNNNTLNVLNCELNKLPKYTILFGRINSFACFEQKQKYQKYKNILPNDICELEPVFSNTIVKMVISNMSANYQDNISLDLVVDDKK